MGGWAVKLQISVLGVRCEICGADDLLRVSIGLIIIASSSAPVRMNFVPIVLVAKVGITGLRTGTSATHFPMLSCSSISPGRNHTRPPFDLPKRNPNWLPLSVEYSSTPFAVQ